MRQPTKDDFKPGAFAGNPAFMAYMMLTIEAHIAMQRGEAESRLDEIRDAMDAPWLGLSGQEQANLNRFSGDLYDLFDPNGKESRGRPGRSGEGYWRQRKAAGKMD